jgi:hypothetical protein
MAVGRMELTGQGVAQDSASAYSQIEWAAWAGNAEAASTMSSVYAQGSGGLPTDAAKEKFWKDRAAAVPTPYDLLDDTPLSAFDKQLGVNAKGIVASMLYVGGQADDPTLKTGQLLAMVSEEGFARLDDNDILAAMQLRTALISRGNVEACAALWTGAETPAVAQAIDALPLAEQTQWADLIAMVARAAQSNQPAVTVTEAQLSVATAHLMNALAPNDRAIIGNAGTMPALQCQAARIFYQALQRINRVDAAIIMRASVFD